MQLVVMGVSGAGKSTVAALIARRTGCALAEGDEFHPASNIARMAAGYPLDDTLRAPWLAAIAGWLTERATRGECAVISCSALTRACRDVLRGAGPDVQIVHLAGPRELIERRLAARSGHFMPRELLASQYATLEPLAADEPGLTVELAGTPEKTPTQIADEVLRTLPWPAALSGLSVGGGNRCAERPARGAAGAGQGTGAGRGEDSAVPTGHPRPGRPDRRGGLSGHPGRGAGGARRDPRGGAEW